MNSSKKVKLLKRKRRVRAKVYGTSKRPRLVVFRSNRHIYAQLIDDEKARTLVSASDLEIKEKEEKIDVDSKAFGNSKTRGGSKVEISRKVGELLAKKALRKKIKKVVFDRGGFRYHGRVRALAEGARKAGLIF